MTNLVLLSYGSINEYRRAVLAVLSFFSYYDEGAPLPDAKVLIFTDSASYFSRYLQSLPVEYILLTPEQITTMMGQVNYRHRVKAVVVADVLTQHPADNLLFFDSDTFFTRHPGTLLASIRAGVSVMHTVEFTYNDNANLSLPHGATVRDFIVALESRTFNTTRGEEKFSGSQQCWNSGVLGLAPEVIPFLPDVFELMDYLYSASHWHIAEQIAFSLILQTRNELVPAWNYVYHYWEGDKKSAADALLAQALDSKFSALPYQAKMKFIRHLVHELPTTIPAYLAQHREIRFKQDAITALNGGQYRAGFTAAFQYLLREPTDKKFWKDVFYHTRRLLLRAN